MEQICKKDIHIQFSPTKTYIVISYTLSVTLPFSFLPPPPIPSYSGTVRRFLEHYGEDIDLIVFISDGQESYYSKVMPLYFPRSAEEEAYAAKALPATLGNEYGEPVIAERTIRITSNPIASGGWGLYTLLHCHRCTPSSVHICMQRC